MKKKRRYRQAAAFLLAAVLILSTGTGSPVFAEAEDTEPVSVQAQVTEPVTEPESPTETETVTGGETSEESELITEPVTEMETDAETEPVTEPETAGETLGESEPETEPVMETESETQNMLQAQVQSAPPAQNQILEDSAKTDEAVRSVQELIDALPAFSDMENMNDDELDAAISQYMAAYEAYDLLTSEQKEQITGAEVLEEFLVLMNSGEPLADLPGREIDLSTLTSTFTISDSNTYSFTGRGSYGITVTSGSPTIVLSDASINVSSGNAINITDGSPTNKVEGSNTVQCSGSSSGTQGAGIYVAQGSSVTITADDRSSTLTARAGRDGAGIGGCYNGNNYTSVPCGDITITNVTVYAYSAADSSVFPGIGAYNTSGSITIDNATVYAYGSAQNIECAPAIGCCNSVPTIHILHGSIIYAYRGSRNNIYNADYIGQGGGFTYSGGQIQTGSGGSITNSTIYMYTGSSTTPDGTKEYTGSGETAYPVEITAAGATPSSVTVGYTTGPTLSVTATTTLSDTLTYQWYKNSVSYANQIDGATSASYQAETGLAVGTYTYKCVVSCGGYTLASDPITFTVENVTQLATPGGLSWDSTTPGRAVWSPVTGATSYTVKLYKDGTNETDIIATKTTSNTYCDFADSMTQEGRYTFKVTAVSTNESYTDSSAESSASAALSAYIVTFDSNGGSSVASQVVISGGKVISPEAPGRTGYSFGGWYREETCENMWNFNSDTVSGTTTIYAKWTLNAPTVNVSADPSNTGTYNNGNTVITLEASASHSASVSYSYQWYKKAADSGNDIVVGTNSSKLELSNISDSGSYYVIVTAKDNEGNEAVSDASSIVEVTINKAVPANPDSGEGYEIDYTLEKITAENGYELSSTNGEDAEGRSELSVTPGTNVYVRLKETNTHEASEWVEVIVGARPSVVLKQTDTTASSITVAADGVPGNAVVSYQLVEQNGTPSSDPEDWQESGTFTGLKAGVTYTVYARCSATSSSFSAETSKSVTTNGATYTVSIPRQATAGGAPISISITEDTEHPFDLGTDGKVNVKIKDDESIDKGILTLTREGASNTITSALYVGESLFEDLSQNVATFTEDSKDSVSLSFAAPTEKDILAGTYKGTVNFEISYTQ